MMHISDLHLGKKVLEFSLIEDQKIVLNQVIQTMIQQDIQVLLIAGDIYDKTIPSIEAVQLFDWFLNELVKHEVTALMISGNHDSNERLGFASSLIEKHNIYMVSHYEKQDKKIVLQDEYGEINFYLIPFVKPNQVRHHFEGIEMHTYQEMMEQIIKRLQLDETKRNVFMTHQYISGASICDSEELSIGGSDAIEASLFTHFDYVALGHLHESQQVKYDYIRYCGTPLKYSISEKNHNKSMTIVQLDEKGSFQFSLVPFIPLHDLKEIKGSYEELCAQSFYVTLNTQDYFHIVLTDEEEQLEALQKLRVIYPNIMKLSYDNARTQASSQLQEIKDIEKQNPLQLFSTLYEIQNNQPMSERQIQYMKQLLDTLQEDK